MVARIGSLVELSFWQAAVRVLSTARPIGRGWSKARDALERQPALQFMPKGWVIAVTGWVLGLAAGITLMAWGL